MKNFYLTPGPSQLYHTVPDHLREAVKIGLPSWSHRGKDFKDVYAFTRQQLFKLLDVPEGWEMIFLNSATEVWERLIQNFVSDTSLHVVTGAFSERVSLFAGAMGKNNRNIVVTENEALEPEKFSSGYSPEVLTLAGNETSTGYWISKEEVKKVRQRFPETLIALDVVSALPHYEVPFDAVDCFYFSAQKGFGLPAGLGVWVYKRSMSEKAKLQGIAPYRQFSRLDEMASSDQTLATPNMLDIYLLGKVCEDMNRRGIQMIRSETIYKATLIKNLFQSHEALQPFVKHHDFQSVTSLVASSPTAEELIAQCAEKGWIIGSGYAAFKGKHLRIANFPAHSKELIEGLVDFLS